MGVVAGKGISFISNALSSGTIDIWVAGTRAGTLLQRCQVNDLSATAPFVFKGSRCLSISFGFDPLVGNTAELWVEGYLDVPGGPSGSVTIAHLTL